MEEQMEHHDDTLLWDTLRNIWQNYLNASDDISDKNHWIQLFLYHFEYVNDETVLQRDNVKSFFNPIPEEILSFLLEQVYEIISKSDLYTPADLNADSFSPIDETDAECVKRKTTDIAKLLRKNHNFAQLILNDPSDCSKIVALRTFLTSQLGQRLLLFLLKVDIKLIASQKSLCNLCINLFPNCPWDNLSLYAELRKPATIFDYIGSLNFYEKATSTRQTLNLRSPVFAAMKRNVSKIWPKSYSGNQTFHEGFKHDIKTSDEIAYILIQLLLKCVGNECDTKLCEQSMSVISLNFALDCLRVANDSFGMQHNAHILKCEFLHLIEKCFNNLFANDDNINEIQFQIVFAKLAAALESNRLVDTKQQGSEENMDNVQFLYALNFIIFGTLHNLVAIYGNNPNICNSKHNLYTKKFIDENVVNVFVETLKDLLQHQVDPETRILVTITFKVLIRVVDNLRKYDQLSLNSGGSGGGSSLNGIQQKSHRRKKFGWQQMHCRMQKPQTLSCFFQGILVSLLPDISTDLQEHAMRYLQRAGTCCCHYTIATYSCCLDLAVRLSENSQKCAYKFLYHKILNAIFVRDYAAQNKKHQNNCTKCDAKLKSLDFHTGMLQLYRERYESLVEAKHASALNLYLKHLKHISHLLTNDIAAGILAEIVLPIFRKYKSKAMENKKSMVPGAQQWQGKHFRGSKSKGPTPSSSELSNSPLRPKLHLHITAGSATENHVDFMKTLLECLNIFVIYLSDIRLIKAFYNEENISHLEDLLYEPELIRGICDLIKIGIDNITFLGDNSQEQIALSRRLITLQLNSSNCAAQMFNALLERFAKCSRIARANFWLNEDKQKMELNAIADCNLKPLEILHIAALQWSLNYELLKTSQYFYNEFAKIYSIVVEDDLDATEESKSSEHEDAKVELRSVSINYLKQGDKTIIDILRLNYNALSTFLILPRKKSTQTNTANITTTTTNAVTPNEHQEYTRISTPTAATLKPIQRQAAVLTTSAGNKAVDCSLSSSLESLLSSVTEFTTSPQSLNLISSSTTSTKAATLTYDSDGKGDTTSQTSNIYDELLNQFYEDTANETFVQTLQNVEEITDESRLLPTKSILLFDIRNQIHSNEAAAQSSVPASTSLQLISSLSSSLSSGSTCKHSLNNTTGCTTTTNGVLTNTFADPKTHIEGSAYSSEGIVGKILGMFGSLFSGSNSLIDLTGEPTKQEQSDDDIDEELLCFYESNGDCKKLLLKFFEATMAICIKGYQNEEVEKMQKHLRKLKAIILSNASTHWQQYSEEHTRDNAIIKTLQTLLKISELSNTVNEPSAVMLGDGDGDGEGEDDGNATSRTDDQGRPRMRSFNSNARPHGMAAYNSHLLPTSLAAKIPVVTPPTPQQRPLSSDSGDVDYFSTRASIICPDSEMELSENDNDNDYYLTADEGYEADGEVPEVFDTEAEVESAELWNSLQPTSRYRTHVLHDGLSRLIVDILMELSEMCTRDPTGWCENLAQLANRLFVIREYLGGSAFLLRGFAPVLKCNDAHLKELQHSILELITDLNTPEVLYTYFEILASKNPPTEILIKHMSFICTSSLKKAQASVELEFPVIIDGKCISTSDAPVTEQIDRVRNYHLHAQASTPFTRAPCIIPITHARVWNNEGFTLSMWLQVKGSQAYKSSSQHIEDDARSTNEGYIKSHIVSIGTNQAMISIYINSNLNLVFETCKPNAELQIRSPPRDGESPTSEPNNSAVINTVSSFDGKNKLKASSSQSGLHTDIPNSPSAAQSVTTSSTPFRYALKQTKLALLNRFSNMHIFNGHPDGEPYEVSSFDLKYFRLSKNKWTHLVFAVDIEPNCINLTIVIDGLEQHAVTLPFANLRNLTRTHVFQMISLGDGVSIKSLNNTSTYNTESRSTLDGYPFRISISNLMLFNRKITISDAIYNLTAMGPDFTELTQCQVANWKPNYGYLNLSRMYNANFGSFLDSMRMLKESRILTYTAQRPELVVGYDAGIELDYASYGHSFGLVLYGGLIQNQLQSIPTATTLCGGLSTLLYLFARVVEVSNDSLTQSMALDVLLRVALSESHLYSEFVRNDYFSLIGFVIRTERCTKDIHLMQSIINNVCSLPLITKRSGTLHVNENTTATLVYPRLIISILHRYSDWHRSGAEHSDVLDMLFLCILALTREKHPRREFNILQLNKGGLVKELLNLCKVYVIESPNPVYISKNAADSLVGILSVFAGSPPAPSLMDEIMKLMLLLHKPSECYITHDRTKFYFLLSSQTPAKEKSIASANLSRVAAPFRRFGRERGPAAAVPATVDSDVNRATRISHLRKLHIKNSPYMNALNEFEENLENVADCTKLNKNSLRLLNPVEVSSWRSKFKRRSSINLPTSPKKKFSPQLRKAASISIAPGSRLSAQNKIVRKRISLNSASSVRSLTPADGEKHKSVSSAHSLSASLANFKLELKETSAFNDLYADSPMQRRNKSLVKTDFYNSVGIVTLQERLLVLLNDFLRILPDNAVEDVLKHYIKVELLLVLSNNYSCAVRTAIIKLLTTLTKRLTQADLLACCKHYYPQHLANQLSIYPTNLKMFEACLEWVSGVFGGLDSVMHSEHLRVQDRFGLNALLAITTKTIGNQSECMEKAFRALRKLYATDAEDQQLLIEAGLLQCCVKALFNYYVRSTLPNSNVEVAILDLLKMIGKLSLTSVGHINIIWDILNLLSFYYVKQPDSVVRSFRSLQAELQLYWITLFFQQTNVPWNYKVTTLPDSTLTLGETKTRLALLIDRCSQFFTVFNANHTPSDKEIKLFEFLVSYSIATNQRYNNFIVWGLQPSRPHELRSFIVDALWITCQDEFLPSIICDSKMIKSFLWLCLLEDLEQPLTNLESLCKHLGINENDSAWNLENELERIQQNHFHISAKQKILLDKTVHKFESLVLNCVDSAMVTTRRVVELQNAERKLLMSQMKDYDETCTYNKWLEIVRRMTHEGAPWYCKRRGENSWELDETEGPSRVHTRLRRCHLDIDRRFIMEDFPTTEIDATAPDAANNSFTTTRSGENIHPLEYLITSYDQQLNISLNSQILYNFPAMYLPVDGEIDGEIVVTDHKLYFMATYRCKYFYVTCDIANITEIWLKRYQHQEKAFEIFLDTNQSFFFILKNEEDWKIMNDVFCDKIVSSPDQSKVLIITQQWREGLLTNWEYLMTLNQFSGRTYKDLMQYPVFPWILSNYTSDVLDLTDVLNFRKMEKPIAVQCEENEQHYINNYTYLNNSMTNMGSMTLKPYHYSSHYSNSGTVLHFLVRVPPFTSYFLRYQDNNFDLPDRTFHALSTTWGLASRDSPTDVKELIPEFFCLPEMFENFENLNFGYRQNGERVVDVQLPPWCLHDPRLFVLIHRQALESEVTRNNLHQWIDLIFGYKQTGESAVDAVNVFHPATYAHFLESAVSDPIERKAVETMIKTYGQMPRQLFRSTHPASKPLNYCLGNKEILQTVRGLRWGVYLGSPQLSTPTLGNIYKLPGSEYLVSFNNTNVVYGLPLKSCVMQGAETDTFNVVSWDYDDHLVRIQPLNKMHTKPKNLLYNNSLDEITACGSDTNSNQLWFGHKSGRISVYKCASVEGNNRLAKGRQSYVRGLRLSYNSAFRKIATKSGIKLDADADEESPHASSLSAAASSSHSSTDALQRDSADLVWCGPTVLVRHSDEITCIHLSVEFKIAVTAGRDGLAVIWDLNDWSYIRAIDRPAEIHHSPITHISISPTLGDIVTVHTIPQHNSDNTVTTSDEHNSTPPLAATADECFEVTEENLDDFVNVNVNPNGKSILRLHSVNARYIQHIVHEDRILAVCYSYIKEGVGVNVIATAVEGGIVRLWSSWNLSFVNEIVTGISHIKSIAYSTHQHLIVLTKDSHIQVWEAEGLYGNAPKFPQIAYK